MCITFNIDYVVRIVATLNLNLLKDNNYFKLCNYMYVKYPICMCIFFTVICISTILYIHLYMQLHTLYNSLAHLLELTHEVLTDYSMSIY